MSQQAEHPDRTQPDDQGIDVAQSEGTSPGRVHRILTIHQRHRVDVRHTASPHQASEGRVFGSADNRLVEGVIRISEGGARGAEPVEPRFELGRPSLRRAVDDFSQHARIEKPLRIGRDRPNAVSADQCQQSLVLRNAQRLTKRCPAGLELIRQLLLTSERVSDGEILAAADYARPRDRSTFREAVHKLCRELPDLVISVVGAAPQVGSE